MTITYQPVPDHVPAAPTAPVLSADELRRLCLEAGADDVGFVSIDSPDLREEADHARAARPTVRTLVSLVVRMNREPIRSPARSVANLEFHHTGDAVNDAGRRIVRALEDRGHGALNPAMGFPMEMDRFPGRAWVVAHKTVAVAAGMGHMGIHRNVIHPRFGSFVLLGTLLLDAEVSAHGAPLDDSPCFTCRLCVTACPVGAIRPDGAFDFSACYTHNYREFMGGFTDWVEQIADAGSAKGYRARVSDSESASMWQSLSFGANYKAAYCLAACPAGSDVLGPYEQDRKGFVDRVVRPLLDKQETVYVAPGSDAEAHVRKRFPHKAVRRVASGLRPTTVDGFLEFLPHLFQPGAAGELSARYHFTFTGVGTGAGAGTGDGAGTEASRREATVVLDAGRCVVLDGLQGEANVSVTADAHSWLRYLRKDGGLLGPLLRRKVRVSGSLRLLRAFERCFPV